MEKSFVIVHILLFSILAVYTAQAVDPCYVGEWACQHKCRRQYCSVGYCTNRDTLCHCSRCKDMFEEDEDIQKPDLYTRPTADTYRPRPRPYPRLQESFKISQDVASGRIEACFTDDEVIYMLRELGFKIDSVHKIIYEGWSSHRNATSEKLTALKKDGATREDLVEFLETLAEMCPGVISVETKELIESSIGFQDREQFGATGRDGSIDIELEWGPTHIEIEIKL